MVTLLLVGCAHSTPQIPKNRYGLEVVDSMALYRSTVRADHDKELVDLQKAIPGVRLDIRYATSDNFMHEPLYPVARAFARRPAAQALAKVQEELRPQGLGLKIFDAYRPYRITEKMWEPIKNPDYVADPAKGSRHNRGCAIDLTLVQLSDGTELDMGTPYDSFSPTASHDYLQLPGSVLEHRKLLLDAMERHGFTRFMSEWWHYDCHDYQRFELLDLPLEQLGK